MLDRYERESLRDQVQRVEQETRMVLPGIQSLFGFQMIAVFNENFSKSLTYLERNLHWIATAFTVLAMILTMAPASFHRLAEAETRSRGLVKRASVWLTAGMFSLMWGIVLDFFIVGRIISGSTFLSLTAAGVVLTALVIFWFVYPIACRLRRH